MHSRKLYVISILMNYVRVYFYYENNKTSHIYLATKQAPGNVKCNH